MQWHVELSEGIRCYDFDEALEAIRDIDFCIITMTC